MSNVTCALICAGMFAIWAMFFLAREWLKNARLEPDLADFMRGNPPIANASSD